MGGLAFADVKTENGIPPHVPRISPALYETISSACQAKLETLFQHVVIPRDAPGKQDYGDIDFLVAGIITIKSRQHSPKKDIWAVVKDILGARFHVKHGGSHSYAVENPDVEGAFVQVDVELCPRDDTVDGPELFEWTRLMKGDADLMQVVGIMHRSLGLTCNDRGLHVRVEEIEAYDKKKSMLFLTRDPNTALEFYDYDVAKYWAGFTSENDLFDWVSNGRFFSPTVFSNRSEKSNDRTRQSKRPMYRRFVEEYMPAHADKVAEKSWTRETVRQEALKWFGKEDEYDAMIEGHRRKEEEEKLWKHVRGVLPVEGNSLGVALKGLKRWVEFQDGKPQIAREANLGESIRWADFVKEENKGEVLAWVKENWMEAKALENGRAKRAKEGTNTIV